MHLIFVHLTVLHKQAIASILVWKTCRLILVHSLAKLGFKKQSLLLHQNVMWHSTFFQWAAHSYSTHSLLQQGAGKNSSCRMLWSQMNEAHMPQYESCVAREVIKALLFITIAFIVSFCLRPRSTALPHPSCFQEKVLSGTVENH